MRALCFSLLLVFLTAVGWGEIPQDSRLGPLKELDGYFPFTPSASVEAWAPRKEKVRRQLLVSLGLWPLPERTPLTPVRHSRLELGDYTVEAVYFESFPGFFVTGNLYLPTGRHKELKEGMPIVLCPYGHWPNGRFLDYPQAEVQKLMASGAEKFENAAHSALQARCVHLARMGCAVFHYDMIGRGDATQITDEIAHKFAKQRPEMISPTRWGLYSPQAEANCHSIMGLQTWNSMRAVDFMQSLPGVYPTMVGVTGASGGATQTMILAALDDRVSFAFPAVMVSTAMQGGCTCENASGLRIGTGNVEFAAMFAPKPMGLTAADDWTKEFPVKGFPELQKHWALLKAPPESLSLAANLQYPHNYNAVSRRALYERVFAEWKSFLSWKIGDSLPEERDFRRLTRAELTVWDDEHPAPKGGPEFERDLLQVWHADAQRQLASPRGLRHFGGPAMEAVLGRSYAEAGVVANEVVEKQDKGTYFAISGQVQNATYGEKLPALYFHPKQWKGTTILWLGDAGKATLLGADGQPRPEVLAMVKAGVSVMGLDLLYQGDFLPPGHKFLQTPVSKNPRQAACFTHGYNYSVFARRVHDVLSARKLIETDQHGTKRFGIFAQGQTGPIAAAARSLAREKFDAAVIDQTDFRFQNITDLRDPMFLPGGAKYGDLPGMLALGAPQPLLLLGATALPPAVAAMYTAEAAPAAAEIQANSEPAGALQWLQTHLK